MRCDINDALNVVGCFRPAGATIRVGGHLVGEDADDLAVERGNLVAAGNEQRGKSRNDGREQLMVRPNIGDDARLHAENGAVLFQRQFHVGNLVAAMNGGGNVLAARLPPLHRSSQFHGSKWNQRFFAVHVELAAKAAANFRRDHAHMRFRHAYHE